MIEKNKQNIFTRSSPRGTVEMNLIRKHEVVGSMTGLAHWVKDLTLLSDVV